MKYPWVTDLVETTTAAGATLLYASVALKASFLVSNFDGFTLIVFVSFKLSFNAKYVTPLPMKPLHNVQTITAAIVLLNPLFFLTLTGGSWKL